MKHVKKSVIKLFHRLGYSIVKNRPETLNFPVESTAEERALMSEILALDQYGLTNNDRRLSMVSVPRLWSVISAVKYVVKNEIPGDIIECGVWRGGCAIAMASILKANNSKKKLYLFDTFSGITEPGEVDIETSTGTSQIHEYQKRSAVQDTEFVNWDYGDFNIEKVKCEFKRRQLTDNVVFVQGDVRKTLFSGMSEPQKLSILRLDTDWYDTTLHEMNILYPRLAKGGVLLVDDYGHYDGARKAVDEYFAKLSKCPMQWVTDYTGRGYIA